jgi:toxin ParE1/3/4
MKYTIDWSKDAGEEFIEILAWHKYNGGKTIAQNMYAGIRSSIKKLGDMPGIGKPVPILKDIGINGYRRIAKDHWGLYYRVEGQAIHIVSVIDERRNSEEILYKKILDGKIK